MFRQLSFALAAFALLLTTGLAGAQSPVPLTYNQGRAMNQFLTSQYSYRTYSGTTPGFYYEVATPYGSEWVSRGYGYARLRITPWGTDGVQYIPPTRYEFVPADQLVIYPPVPTLVPYAAPSLVPYMPPARP